MDVCTLSSGVKADVREYVMLFQKDSLGYDGQSALSQSQYDSLVSTIALPANPPANEEEEKEKASIQQIVNFLRPKAVEVYHTHFFFFNFGYSHLLKT